MKIIQPRYTIVFELTKSAILVALSVALMLATGVIYWRTETFPSLSPLVLASAIWSFGSGVLIGQGRNLLYLAFAAIEARFSRAHTYYLFGEELYIEDDDTDRAIGFFDEAIRLNPRFVDAFRFRAHALLSKGDPDRAIQDYTKTIELIPTAGKIRFASPHNFALAISYNDRGKAYHSKGEYHKALADHTEAIRLSPFPAAYSDRGQSWESIGDRDSAVADLRIALSLSPRLEEAKRAMKRLGYDT